MCTASTSRQVTHQAASLVLAGSGGRCACARGAEGYTDYAGPAPA
jgi:hypothetical protein